jgi:type I restriction enzyme S subunit
MSWQKVKLGNLCIIEKGSTGIQKAIPGKFPLVVTGEERKTHNEYQFNDEAVIVPLVSGTGHGHASIKRIHYQTGKFALGSILCAIIPKDKTQLNAEFLFRYLDLNKEKELVARMKGMANVTLPIKEIEQIEIPLPSINIQNEFIKFYKNIENHSFDISNELTHQLSLIKQLRQSFLREALQGKLVAQDKNDEPASELLNRIKAEKEKLFEFNNLKQGKIQEPEIQTNLLFDVPFNWICCTLDEISIYITDGTHQTPAYTASGRIFLSAQNIKPFKFMPYDYRYVSEDAYQEYTKNRKAEKGDILVARVGAGIGEAAVIDKDIEFAFYVSLGLIKTFKTLINSDYLALVINSPYGVNYSKGNISSKGGSAGNFNLGRIRAMKIPLPPLSEQNRIVTKLNQLMKMCDELEQSITQSKEQTEMLLQVALKEALEVNSN